MCSYLKTRMPNYQFPMTLILVTVNLKTIRITCVTNMPCYISATCIEYR